MIVKYESNNGQSVNLNQLPYRMLISDILDYEPEVIENNGKIRGFNSNCIAQREINIDVHRTKTETARVFMSKLTDIFASDVTSCTPGKLYIDEWYIPCYFFGRETSRWDTGVIISCSYKVITDHPSWITEQQISIKPITDSEESTDNSSYPYTYPYTYGMPSKTTSVKIDHYAASDFRMIVYGPTANVSVTINGHIYHVEYPIEDDEYMVIDSRSFLPPDERIYLVRQNGEKVNVFNYRDPEHSIFQKIPAGDITIDYSRKYGIDLIVFLERSEPKWK